MIVLKEVGYLAKRKWNQQTLLQATEQLLLERGYHGFHFGALIEKLAIKRTTLYDHFRDKDDLITLYAYESFRTMLDRCAALEPSDDPFRDLEQLMKMLAPFGPFLRLYAGLMPLHDAQSAASDERVEQIQEWNLELRQIVFDAVGQGQWRGRIRKDIKAQRITDLLFHGLNYSETAQANASGGVEQVLDVLLRGMAVSG